MTRLPIIHGDLENWDAILNAFLSVALNADGSLKAHETTHIAGGTDALPWTSVHGYGTSGALPAASGANTGYVYYETNTKLFKRSNGATWDTMGMVPPLSITDAEVAAANKDGVAGTVSMRTLGTTSTSAAAGNDARFAKVQPFGQKGTLAAPLVGAQRFTFPASATLSAVFISVGTAPTGTSLIVDVNKNGTTIFTTQANRPTIAISGFTATSGAPNITSVVAGDYITVDIDQVGSTIPGSDLTVQINYS